MFGVVSGSGSLRLAPVRSRHVSTGLHAPNPSSAVSIAIRSTGRLALLSLPREENGDLPMTITAFPTELVPMPAATASGCARERHNQSALMY